ncbi:hypothetical protein ACP70R_033348 [Stipagrostis hirtigluma subsp. patula]
MHPPSAFLLIMVAAGVAGVRGLPPAAGTPAAEFWEKALPGTPMPDAIADLVQKGIDYSPLKANHIIGLLPLVPLAPLAAIPITIATGVAEKLIPDAIEHAFEKHHNKHSAPPPPRGKPASSQKAVEKTVMTLTLPSATVPAILPRHAAEKAPFTNLTDVLATFHIAPGSADAALVEKTLLECQAPPVAGEQKACATSLEGTVQAAARMLRGASTAAAGDRTMWAAASAIPRGGLPRQEYVVTAVAELDGDRHVRCHAEPFPYAVFECHMARRSSVTRAYMITLSSLHEGSSVTVAMVMLCHLDTSYRNPEQLAFETPHTKPGGEPVCQFMPYANLVFGEKATS